MRSCGGGWFRWGLGLRMPLCLRRWRLSWGLSDQMQAAMLASGRTQEYWDSELRMTVQLASGNRGWWPRSPPPFQKRDKMAIFCFVSNSGHILKRKRKMHCNTHEGDSEVYRLNLFEVFQGHCIFFPFHCFIL